MILLMGKVAAEIPNVVEFASGGTRLAARNECGKNSSAADGLIAANGDLCRVGVITFFYYRFFGGGAQRLLVRVFRRVAIAANHFFAVLNAHQPLGFAGVPGDFHSIGGHRFLQGELDTL